jgi:hypothetical protein
MPKLSYERRLISPPNAYHAHCNGQPDVRQNFYEHVHGFCQGAMSITNRFGAKLRKARVAFDYVSKFV